MEYDGAALSVGHKPSQADIQAFVQRIANTDWFQRPLGIIEVGVLLTTPARKPVLQGSVA